MNKLTNEVVRKEGASSLTAVRLTAFFESVVIILNIMTPPLMNAKFPLPRSMHRTKHECFKYLERL